ncbi:MAG TPA: hypothetical protein EYG89_02785 [Bacteroidia bacterium]|nr:hypothetical protein [Bacteroidia bacterium]
MKTLKKTIYFLSITLLIITSSCSSDDDSSNNNETYQNLIGRWYFDNPNNNPIDNNSFTFTSEGNVTYSYWTSSGVEVVNEIGTFSVDDEIMTMIFSEGVTLTYVQKVIFINDNVVEFQPTGVSGENAYEGDYFRDGADSYESPDGTLKEYQLMFSGSSSSSQQYPLNIIYYIDDENGQISTQAVNSQTNTDIIQSISLETVDKFGFKYDVSGYEQSIINYVEIKNVQTGIVIFSISSLEIQDNQIFTYDISENSYTIQ